MSADETVRLTIKLFIDPENPFLAEDSEGNEYSLEVSWDDEYGPVARWVASSNSEEELLVV